MLNQLIAKLSKPKPIEDTNPAPTLMLNDAMRLEPLALKDAFNAPVPDFDPHHTIEVVDDLIGHLMDNGRFTGCMTETDDFHCGTLADGIETAIHEGKAMGLYVAEDVCALSLKSADAHTVSHVALTTLFRHRTEMDPVWEQGDTPTGQSFSWLAPLSDTHGLLITCTDEPVDPMCDGTPHAGASLFLQLVAQH